MSVKRYEEMWGTGQRQRGVLQACVQPQAVMSGVQKMPGRKQMSIMLSLPLKRDTGSIGNYDCQQNLKCRFPTNSASISLHMMA